MLQKKATVISAYNRDAFSWFSDMGLQTCSQNQANGVV